MAIAADGRPSNGSVDGGHNGSHRMRVVDLNGPAESLPADGAATPQILFLDAYDSFTNNIVSLLHKVLGQDVVVYVLHIDLKTLASDPTPDWTLEQFGVRLRSFHAVVCGPGPGSPLNPADVGVFQHIWDLADEQMVPVLGICLGFQSLVQNFGGSIRKLHRGLHGMVRRIEHLGRADGDIFTGVPPFRATLYHSLCADIGQDSIPDQTWEDLKWLPTPRAPDLIPLAWTTEAREDGDERILMAVKHASKPFWGLQYHPESVCTEAAAQKVMRNWFRHAMAWNAKKGRFIGGWRPPQHSPGLRRENEDTLSSLLQSLVEFYPNVAQSRSWATQDEYSYLRLPLPTGVETADIAEVLGQGGDDSIIFDSSSARKNDPLATTSIIALDVKDAVRLEYRARDSHITMRCPSNGSRRILVPEGYGVSGIWRLLTDYWQTRLALNNFEPESTCKFKGGFMGYVTYEMGLNDVTPEAWSDNRSHDRPDLCMVWVQRSVVIDHKDKAVFIQALAPSAEGKVWIDSLASKLQSSPVWCAAEDGKPVASHTTPVNEVVEHIRINKPDARKYEEDVRRCQDAITEGDSYELCLTAQTTMLRPQGDSIPKYLRAHNGDQLNGNGSVGNLPQPRNSAPWDIYRTFRARQPAPFGSFIRIGGATMLSSSPERFLSIDEQGLCAMRPMKGTVRKSETVSTLAQAEEILHIPKEEAENLMIVDLVRHDLHGICGPGKVTVPELLKVEEYESVFQMVTAVNGQLPQHHTGRSSVGGFEVLGSVFPPGSMTGAPKKRSCEILRTIEPTERSLYSGVVGYLDITGRSDWSVTIRTMFRWDDETTTPGDSTEPHEVWHIGAGGAVTILSTPEGEREEMELKLRGPLGAFWDAA
ncbi:aminodeoxychorismate synthase [Paramyrothecium foliicola]|nr:aminodeoxychorismate synthase [Paramyrothecium foliicola]